MLAAFRTQVLAALGSPAVPVSYNTAKANQSLPYVVLHRVGGTFQAGVSAPIGQSTALMQADLYAGTYKKLEAMIDALRVGLHGYRGGVIQGVFLESVRDNPPETEIADRVYSAQLDFSVQYREA